MKLAKRIGVIADILVAALHADETMTGQEAHAARALLADLLLTTPEELPEALERRIADFTITEFDLREAANEFMADPPMKRRRLLELVVAVTKFDGSLDLREDDFIRALGRALDMEPEEYADLVLQYEISELRDSFKDLITAITPPPTSKEESKCSVPPPIPKAARATDR